MQRLAHIDPVLEAICAVVHILLRPPFQTGAFRLVNLRTIPAVREDERRTRRNLPLCHQRLAR